MLKVIRFEGKKSIIRGLGLDEFSELLSNKRHLKYLEKFLECHSVKTLVFEAEYIDHDYLEDYSHYYSKCFKPYPKKCTRVHFFSTEFNKQQFESLISRKDENVEFEAQLQAEYVGFVVFKPIPLTIIGKTCLKPDLASCSIKCPILRKYDVHLFGLNLSVSTLAFQEQDNTVSACATSAVWSALQGTGMLFHHRYPSPFEITSSAAKYSPNRIFPNKGLDSLQMATAIKECGLEPLLCNLYIAQFLKGLMYAYLKCGIPVIMGLELHGIKTDKETTKKTYKKIGYHAVTVAGYKISDNGIIALKELNLQSQNITEIYVHDDQLGPFAKMQFREMSFTTDWVDSDAKDTSYDEIIAKPTLLLIPVYNKIRISFDKIYKILEQFTRVECRIIENKEIIWDVYLQSVSDLKQSIRRNQDISPENKAKLLSRAFPKYIWVAEACIFGEKNVSIFFDATDLENGKLFLCAIHYRAEVYNIFSKLTTEFEREFPEIRHKEPEYDSFLENNFILPHYTDSNNIYFPGGQLDR